MAKGRDDGMPLFDRLVEHELAESQRAELATGAEPPPAGRPGDRESPYSVSAVVKLAAGALDRHVGTVWVEGEVLELKQVNGHLYFSLKDERAQISAVMWRSDARRLRFRLEPGTRARCRGNFGIYEVRGQFQLYVSMAEPAGVGAEAVALEQLKRKLAEEGLFATARKRALPRVPHRIGVVTSRSGAALRDIVRVVHRRFAVPILLVDAQVQGADAPRQIVLAMRAIAEQAVDLVIVGRGGGSAVDLSAFNDERVVRAVAECPVPTISAVGHEVDVTLTDLVADHRAATPSQAGEMAVPVLADLAAALRQEEQRLNRELMLRVASARQHVDQLVGAARTALSAGLARARRALGEAERGLAGLHPGAQVISHRAELAELGARAAAAMQRRQERAGRQFAELTGRLDALSPLRVLDRGYAIARSGERVLTSWQQVEAGDAVEVKLGDGSLDCRVEGAHGD